MTNPTLHTNQGNALPGNVIPDTPLIRYLQQHYALNDDQLAAAWRGVAGDMCMLEGFIRKNRWALSPHSDQK